MILSRVKGRVSRPRRRGRARASIMSCTRLKVNNSSRGRMMKTKQDQKAEQNLLRGG